MKVYKVELMIIDFYGLGAREITTEIENTRYANHCISPEVMRITEKDIGELKDSHPLNSISHRTDEYDKLFANE